MSVGLSAKNGRLIVEFANQLRDMGKEVHEALIEAADTRLRPIIMTGITTAAGSIPLIISSGSETETRLVMHSAVGRYSRSLKTNSFYCMLFEKIETVLV